MQHQNKANDCASEQYRTFPYNLWIRWLFASATSCACMYVLACIARSLLNPLQCFIHQTYWTIFRCENSIYEQKFDGMCAHCIRRKWDLASSWVATPTVTIMTFTTIVMATMAMTMNPLIFILDITCRKSTYTREHEFAIKWIYPSYSKSSASWAVCMRARVSARVISLTKLAMGIPNHWHKF